MEKVEISAENSVKRHLERNEYNEGDVVLLTNLISKLTLRNQRKELSIKTERHDIKGVVTNTKHQIFCLNNWDCQWKRRNWSTT